MELLVKTNELTYLKVTMKKNLYKKNNIEYPFSEITKNIRVSVYTNYLSDQSDPYNNIWLWSYHILIENNNSSPIKLIDRHWIITDASGKIQEVKGEGVIGKQPKINPGNYFEYSSGTPLKEPSGFMTGTYGIQSENEKYFKINIPTFSLDIPSNNIIIN